MRAALELERPQGAIILKFPVRRRRNPRLERWIVAALAIAFTAFLAGAARPVADRDAASVEPVSLLLPD